MLDPENYDPRPLRIRVMEVLENFPDGLTTKELAHYLGEPQYTVSAIVSRLFLYGPHVEKINRAMGPGVKWRLASKP